MCGIAGWVDLGGARRTSVDGMLEALRHRGPDATGVWRDEQCVLGHTRLAIIDTSDAGCQPMSDADGRVWIVFNGEIYNFQSLRRELEARGHRFTSHTDTETIVYAYLEWGVECVHRLRGMFAFALWDARERRLFLARDRVGKKPLFLTRQGGRLLFASELQGLLADPSVSREVDPAAVDSYLSWGYIPAPRTVYQGVDKLPPGHWLTVDLRPDGPVERIERYWSLDYRPKYAGTVDDAAEELRERMREAVRLRLVSDVPLGAFLSGGIDSSVVVGLMSQLSSEPVRTFSIGFEEAAYNELDHARRVAERWGTDHTEAIVRPDALDVVPRLARHYGEPYADSSAVPTYYVAQMAREHVTVALNGDGGDESFAGYDRYRASEIAARIARIPGHRGLTGLLASVLPDSPDPKSVLRRARRFLSVAHQPMVDRYARWMSYFTEEDKAELYRPEFWSALTGPRPRAWVAELFGDTDGLAPADAAMSVDVRSYLPYDLLVKVDIASMAHSLEARSPFLDHELMEFAARLPVGMKLHRRTSKYLVKRAFQDLLPKENVARPKMGFGVPVGEWFRGPLRDLLHDTVLATDSLVGDYLERRAVERVAVEHLERRADHTMRLWALLMLEMSHREIANASPPAPLSQPS